MRREHFERLRPVCPTCRAIGRPAAELRLGAIVRAEDDDIREGVLICTEQACQREHPIVDGIPILVSDLPSWATHQLDAVLWRSDLSAFTESLLGDAAGPGSEFDRQRTTLSAYGRVHWGDFDCEEPLPREASLAALLAWRWSFSIRRPLRMACGLTWAAPPVARRTSWHSTRATWSWASI